MAAQQGAAVANDGTPKLPLFQISSAKPALSLARDIPVQCKSTDAHLRPKVLPALKTVTQQQKVEAAFKKKRPLEAIRSVRVVPGSEEQEDGKGAGYISALVNPLSRAPSARACSRRVLGSRRARRTPTRSPLPRRRRRHLLNST